MAKLIKTAKEAQKTTYRIGQVIKFPTWVPLQNVGSTCVHRVGTITKVNRVTVHVKDKYGNTWSVNMDEIVPLRNFSDAFSAESSTDNDWPEEWKSGSGFRG